MLLKYNGEFSRESRSYSGCGRCGTGIHTSSKETYKTRYQFYDGSRMVVFEKGKCVDVDPSIGAFLLRKTTRDKSGKLVNTFEECIVEEHDTEVEPVPDTESESTTEYTTESVTESTTNSESTVESVTESATNSESVVESIIESTTQSQSIEESMSNSETPIESEVDKPEAPLTEFDIVKEKLVNGIPVTLNTSLNIKLLEYESGDDHYLVDTDNGLVFKYDDILDEYYNESYPDASKSLGKVTVGYSEGVLKVIP